MELADLTGDGAKDLLLITNNPAGQRVARLYQYHIGLDLVGEAATSAEAVSVERMTSGRVRDSLPAVFAEQKTAGGVGLTTDIFVYADGTLQNLALDSEDSINRGTYRPVSVYAADINGDGVTELPRAVLMAGYDEAAATDALFMLDWYAYSADAAPERSRPPIRTCPMAGRWISTPPGTTRSRRSRRAKAGSARSNSHRIPAAAGYRCSPSIAHRNAAGLLYRPYRPASARPDLAGGLLRALFGGRTAERDPDRCQRRKRALLAPHPGLEQ